MSTARIDQIPTRRSFIPNGAIIRAMESPDTGGRLDITFSSDAIHTRLNALAPRQGVVIDGSVVATTRDVVKLGTGAISVAFTAATAVTDATRAQFYFATDNGTNFTDGVQVFQSGTNPSALTVTLRQTGSSSAHYAVRTPAGVFDGTPKTFFVTIDNSGADPVVAIYVNGVAQSLTVITAKTGSFDDSGVTRCTVGGSSGSGTVVNVLLKPATVFNFALPATTTSGVVGVAERYADGVWVRPSERGQPANLFTAGNSVSYATAADAGSASQSPMVYDFTTSDAFGFQQIRIPLPIKTGTRILVNVSGFVSTGGTTTTFIRNYANTAALATGVGITGDGTVVLVATGDDTTGFWLRIQNSLTAQTVTATVSVTVESTTLDLQPQGIGRTIIDRSANRNHATVSGTTLPTYLQPTDGGKIVTRTNLATNQQLLALAAFDAANRYRITSWTVTALTGTPTISLGNASAGAQYVSGLTLATGVPTAITLLTTIAATANLWCNSNSTDVIIHTITYERISD
jgi:hypothetical protein